MLVISLLFTTIVYSSFSTQLQIRGEAIARSDQIIRITGLKLLEATNGAYETYNSKYEKDTTSLYVTLPPSSYMTYEVAVTNKNAQLIYRLQELLTLINNNSNVAIEYGIVVGDCINSNETKTFTIKLTNNTSSEQALTLINQYKFELENWNSLETEFLSSYDTGDLSVNKEGVIFEFSVKNTNTFSVNYSLTSDNPRFIVKDEATNNGSFQIEPNTTVTHQVRITLRDDVTYENYSENLKLMLKTTSPLSSKIDIKTVTLTLPQYFKTLILNSIQIKDSPTNFSGPEATNGYLLRINEINAASYTYYYRGVIDDNYVLFADNLWRVVRIDANGNVRVVLNDNVSSKSQYTKNYVMDNVQNIEEAKTLLNYKNSDVRTNVEAWYNQNIASKEESKFVMNSNFCIDMSYDDPMDTQYEHTVYYFTPYLHVGSDSNSFSPNFTCADENIFTSPVGLLSAEEILAAGGFWDTANKNYYLYNPNLTEGQISWTMSGSYYSLSEKQAGVIVFNQDVDENEKSLFDWVWGGNLAQYYGYRPVISLNGNVKVVGDGTIDNPYQLFE